MALDYKTSYKSKRRRRLIIIIASVLAALALLGTSGYFIAKSVMNKAPEDPSWITGLMGDKTSTEASEDQKTTEASTMDATDEITTEESTSDIATEESTDEVSSEEQPGVQKQTIIQKLIGWIKKQLDRLFKQPSVPGTPDNDVDNGSTDTETSSDIEVGSDTEVDTDTEEGSDTEIDSDTEDTETVTEATTEATKPDKKNKKYGKPLTRQPIHLFTIGIPRISLDSIEREYERSETRVDDSYFDDALFIGDSRTEGFMMYSDLTNIHAYCSKGLNISKIYEEELVDMGDGRVLTVMDALREQEYKKIYIMFGVNELGWPYDDLFIEQYTKMIYDIKQSQPECIIYVQNILPVSAEKSSKDAIYNNANVAHFNEMIKQVCQDQNVIYLDVASSVADETGALPKDASPDGIHCNGEYCNKWLEYLRNNTYNYKVNR